MNTQYSSVPAVCKLFSNSDSCKACHLCATHKNGDNYCILNYCLVCGENIDHPDHERSINTCEGCHECITQYIKCPKHETLEACGSCGSRSTDECDENFCVECGVHHECYTRYVWCSCSDGKADAAEVCLLELFSADTKGVPYGKYRVMRNEIVTLMRYLVWYGEQRPYTRNL